MSSAQILSISGISIKQDSHGRFCLNDLHKAAGGEKKHRPNYWLELQGTKDLIEFLDSEKPIADISAIFTKQGLGTFVVKELVYSYAMWISAKFQITVIRAYDAMVNQKPYGLKEVEQPKYQPYTCPAYERITYIQREALTKIVHKIQNCCHFQNQANNAMYKQIRDQYKLDTIENLPAMHFDDVYAGLQNVLLLAEKHFENMVANDRRFIDCVIKKRQLPSAMQYSLLMA